MQNLAQIKHVRSVRDYETKTRSCSSCKNNKHDVGSNAYKASLDGFKLKGSRLPRYFNVVINNARRLIYSRKLDVDNGGVSRTMSERTKRKLFEISVTLITTCDLMSGQVGKAKNIGF
ncbi:hypothetical protein Sbal625DRAFT_4434, partial [Shewanella baltica OS625]